MSPSRPSNLDMFAFSTRSLQASSQLCTNFCIQTSVDRTGSGTMNTACNYSSAYCILRTASSFTHHGMTFTIGRGNDIVCLAITHIASPFLNRALSSLVLNIGANGAISSLTANCAGSGLKREPSALHSAQSSTHYGIFGPVWRVVAEMSAEGFVRYVELW